MKLPLKVILLAASALVPSGTANAATILADTVLDFYSSGAGAAPVGSGLSVVAFGGGPGVGTSVQVPLSYAADGDSQTYVSLPTLSYIVLGFSSGFVFDGVGNDIFVDEIGNGGEDARIYVSSDYGLSFTLLGTAYGNQTNNFDLGSIGYSSNVNAVKVEGLDNGGSSPGFDLTYVQGLEGSSTVVPLPASLPLLAAGIGALGYVGRRKKTNAS